jgi:signal peptidase
MHRYLHTLGTLLLVIVVAPFVVFAVPQVVGASQGYVVVSSSMSPTIQAGDVVIVDDVRPTTLAEGDIITYERQGGTADGRTDRVTHRVVEVVQREDGLFFRTRGDANEEPDPELVPSSAVTGHVVFTIPKIGWVITYAGTPAGILGLVVVPMAILALGELLTLYRGLQVDADTDDTASGADD